MCDAFGSIITIGTKAIVPYDHFLREKSSQPIKSTDNYSKTANILRHYVWKYKSNATSLEYFVLVANFKLVSISEKIQK